MKKKLVLTIGMWIVFVGAAIGSINYFETQKQLQTLMDAQLREAAQIIFEQSLHEMREHVYESSDVILQEELLEDRNLPMVEFQILGSQGQLILRSSKVIPYKPLSDKSSGYDTKELASEPWRIFVLTSKDQKLQVQVAQKISFRKQLGKIFFFKIVIPLTVLLLLLLFFVSYTVVRSFKPLELLAAEVKNRGPDDLAPLNSEGIDLESELQPIVKEMNGLMRRLHKALESEKLLTANAAHELRTPLAQLKLQTQVALSTSAPEKQRLALQTMNEVIDKLSRRVSQLLAFARLDHESFELSKRPFDLQKLVKEEVAAQVPLCLERKIEVSAQTEAFTVDGYEDLFGILIRNLLENAIKHTPENGVIAVALVRADNGRPELTIVDSGPGMNQDDLSKFFAESSRHRLSSKEGTGLGLALVKKIAELHGADLLVENCHEQTGLFVKVTFS